MRLPNPNSSVSGTVCVVLRAVLHPQRRVGVCKNGGESGRNVSWIPERRWQSVEDHFNGREQWKQAIPLSNGHEGDP